MKKSMLWVIIAVLVALLLAAVAFLVFGYWMPYNNALSSFPAEGTLVFYQLENGCVQINWPRSEDTDQYLLEVLIPQEGVPQEQWQVEYSCFVTGEPRHTRKNFSDQERMIRLRAVKEYSFPFEQNPRQRMSENAICVTDSFAVPEVRGVEWVPDPDTDQVTLTLDVDEGCITRVYELSKPNQAVATFTGGTTTLSFGEGEDKDFPLPAFHETYEFTFDAYRQTENFIYYGLKSQKAQLMRQDFLGTDLQVQVTQNRNNTYTFSWNETKGDYYLVQHRQTSYQSWKTLTQIPYDGVLTYTTAALGPYTYQEYRVLAKYAGDGANDTPVAQSDTQQVQTGATTVYSTIWPIKDLTVYSDPQKTEKLGTAKAGSTFCISDMENDMFQVLFDGKLGYIDSNYCMINLPDMLGDLCLYDITNSYASLYKVHELDIPTVTGTVIIGYEQIRLEENSYLVPLLYPTALKLEQAALAADKQGYQLRIYDSYRPHLATTTLYEIATEFCKQPLPETVDNKEPDSENIYETVEAYMTKNGKYALNYFLAKSISMHNRGLAMDMTLVYKNKDLEMQTPMHDLSWNSEIKLNNENAKLLEKIMKSAGFGGLVSEWWHFQDDEARSELQPPALEYGVSPEGWVADENGWLYRKANGRFYTDCTVRIGGVQYRFDSKGYVQDAPWEA